jgi:DNA-binding transcriptional regulator YdaS (Cro superfamily)
MREADNPIRKIAEQFGGVTAMARRVGVSQPSVSDWVANSVVPSRQIPSVIKAGRQMTPPIILEPNDFFCICLCERSR